MIRRNHQTGECPSCPCAGVLFPIGAGPRKAGASRSSQCETVHSLPTFRDAYKTKVPNNAAAEKAGSAENRDNTIARGCHGSSVSTLVRSPAGLILKVHIGQRLAGVILHDEAGVHFPRRPRRREAAWAFYFAS